MRLVDKLVLKDLIGPFLNGMQMFLLLVFTAGFLFRATDMVVQGVAVNLVLSYILYALPGLVTQTFPMAMLLAALLAFGRLSSDREAVALFASGISFPSAARSVFVMGALVSLTAFIWDQTVVPPATRKMYDIQQQAIRRLARSDRPIAYNIDRRDHKGVEETVKIDGGYDARTRTLRDVTLVKYSSDPARRGDVELTVHCASATSIDQRGLDRRGLNWTYNDGYIVSISKDRTTGYVDSHSFNFKTVTALPNDASPDKSFEQIMNTDVSDSNRSTFAQLRAEIAADREEGRLEDARGKEVDLYGKIALPLASMIFGVVGAALGLNTQRSSGRAVGFGMAIFIVFLYWVFYHSMFVVGKSGGLPPMLASFAADIVGALVGIGLALRASR